MKYVFTFFYIAIFVISSLKAQEDHKITISIAGYESDTVMLAYYYGEKQYVKDTMTLNAQGQFVFAGEEPLPSGIYLAVMKPDNDYFQFMVNESEQHFQLHTSKGDPVSNMEVTGSFDNALLYGYLQFLDKQRQKVNMLNQQKEQGGSEAVIQEQLDILDNEVVNYQRQLINEYPMTLTAAIIKANLPLDMPDFNGTEEEVEIAKWRYTQKHYFDNINLGDNRLLHTPFLFQRIDHYVNKLQVQHPDTLMQVIDYVLEKMRPAPETFQYYLIHFLNSYAKSKIVGFDAIYVHLVEQYYATGQAHWTENEQLEKILENAKKLKPLLIGKKAPNITVQDRKGNKVVLHEIDSEYTILYFWRYDCGTCKKSTPKLKEFYEEFKNKGVKIIAICNNSQDLISGCWEYVEENKISDWLHTVDPYMRSRVSMIYDIQSTPQIYVLDREKVIVSKRISAEDLGKVLNHLMNTQ
jgi:thiol-disulfide isomerase/thioredoxin